MKLIRTLLWALFVVAILQSIYYYPQMPENVASHFNGDGEPNGWSSRFMFFIVYFCALILTLVIFLALPGWSVNRKKVRINMPKRDYWFHPERREATLEYIKLQFLWFGVANMILALIIVQMVIKANLSAQPILGNGVYWVLGAWGVFVLLWLTRFLFRFLRQASKD